MRDFKTDFENAPRDGEQMLMAIPTGDPDAPIELSVGWWDDEYQMWTGHWQSIEGLEEVQPIAYADGIELPEEVILLAEKIAADVIGQPELSEAIG